MMRCVTGGEIAYTMAVLLYYLGFSYSYMFRYHLGRFFFGCIRSLPFLLQKRVALVGGWCLYHSTKKISIKSLAIAFPEKSLDERRLIAKQSAVNNIARIIEALCLDKQRSYLSDMHILKEAYQPDKGLLIASLHMGPVELAAYQLQKHGLPSSVVIGSGKKSPWLHALGRHLFGRYNLSVIPKGCPFSLLKALRQGHCITFHCDLRARDAVEVAFFGETVKVSQGIISLALLHNMPVVYHYAQPDAKGGWNLQFASFDMERTGDYQRDLQVNLQKLMGCIEETIRQHPEQWVWCYDRFKLKRRLRNNQTVAE